MFAVFRRAGWHGSMRLRVYRSGAVAIFALVVYLDNWASAAPLPVGEAVAPSLAYERFTGDLVAGSLWTRFSAPGFSGLLKSAVLTNEQANPFGAGKLTFAYVLGHPISSVNALDRLVIASFANTQVDVNIGGESRSTGFASAVLAERSTAAAIAFSFHTSGRGPMILPGAESGRIIVHTDATEFAPTFGSVFGGSVVPVETFAPLPAIPEPSALVLASIGVIGATGLLWRARTRRQACFHSRGAARAN
jgi:hypothetical protein